MTLKFDRVPHFVMEDILKVYTLRDIAARELEGCRTGQKSSYRLRFCSLNSSCTRRSITFNVSKL